MIHCTSLKLESSRFLKYTTKMIKSYAMRKNISKDISNKIYVTLYKIRVYFISEYIKSFNKAKES